jgi:hypothetical protein
MSIANKILKMKSIPKLYKIVTNNSNSSIPFQSGTISVEYSYSFPIEELHEIIIYRIKSYSEIEIIEEELERLYERFENAKTIIEEKSISEAVEKFEEKIKTIENGDYLMQFLCETNPLIEEYLSMGYISENISFVSDKAEEKTEKVVNLGERKSYISDIVERYLEIISRYVEIDVTRKINTDVDECIGCGYNMSEVYIDEAGEQICTECRMVRYKYNMAGHKGIKSFTGSRMYDVQVTFRRELLQFQGKEKVHIPEEVYDLLDKRFQSIGMPPVAKIKMMKLNEYGKMPDTSLNLLDDGLQCIGYPSLYKHANKIGKKLWGWVLHDLQELTPVIMKDFNEWQVHFPYVDKGGRTSNTCSQARLLQHLRHRDIHVSFDDFKLPGMSSLIANEQIFRQMCEKSGRTYKPMFPNHSVINKDHGITLVTNDGIRVFLSGDDRD